MTQWTGRVPAKDDFGLPITYEFIDGRSNAGAWMIFTPRSWYHFGCGKLGPGYGQRYQRSTRNIWTKVEG
jgi:hypothetical protein